MVAGGARGLGAALVWHLAKNDWTVVIHYLTSKGAATNLLTKIRRLTPNSMALAADLREAQQARQLINSIWQNYQQLDLVVNNVGNFIYKPLSKTSPEEWNDVIGTNLNATFYACHYALPLMRRRQCGHIINFAAVDAGRLTTRAKTTPYYIAKTGVTMLTKQLAADNASYGIRVNAIAPGILQSSVVKLPTPTKKYVQFADIARVVDFLLAPQNINVNGATVEVAGGFKFC